MSKDELRIAASLVAERNGLARECDSELLVAAENLAAAWLAEHPDDDDEPITDEWAEETWPDVSDDENASVDVAVIFDNPRVTLTNMGGGDWSLFVDTENCDGLEDSQWLRNVETRRDVRVFLHGMGVDTKGGE